MLASCVRLPVLLVGLVILFMYAVAHFLIVVPVAYFGYLITSVPIEAIIHSGGDMKVAMGDDAGLIRELVIDKEVAFRNFAVALPAFMISFVLKISPLLRRRRERNKAADKT